MLCAAKVQRSSFMNLLSYRGPGVAGGVSTGLGQVWLSARQIAGRDAAEQQAYDDDSWWFIEGNAVTRLQACAQKQTPMNLVDERVISGHYRFCNEFLWPVMHDLCQYATYNQPDRDCYESFNATYAQIVCSTARKPAGISFVQDYQLAMLPLFLKLESGRRSTVFWHIPWPRRVPIQYVEPIAAIARALLSAEHVGFHISEYAHNFMRFVRDYLPSYEVDMHNGFVSLRRQGAAGNIVEAQFNRQHLAASYITRPLRRLSPLAETKGTSIQCYPLTIDADNWRNLAGQATGELASRLGVRTKFVLSVDRADYTKGVRDRFHAIDQFLAANQSWREHITFLQICGRTRPGMKAFDEYWTECRVLCEQVNARWQTESWSPINWIDEKLNAVQLADLYRDAEAMLITAVRDGLNLTAKEYVACQNEGKGVLLLSPQTGVWQEFEDGAVRINMHRASELPQRISEALSMPADERRRRLHLLNQRLSQRSLDDWWHFHTTGTVSEPAARTAKVVNNGGTNNAKKAIAG